MRPNTDPTCPAYTKEEHRPACRAQTSKMGLRGGGGDETLLVREPVSQPRRTSGAENMGSWGEDLLQRVLCMGRMQRAPENSPRGPDEEDPPSPMQKLTAVSQGVSGKLQETLVTMPKAAAEAAAAGVAAGAAVMRTFKKSDLQEFRDPDMAHSSIVKSAGGQWH